MSIYSSTSIPQGVAIYANATLFPLSAQDGELAVAADTNTIYIYDSSVPGWQPVANPGAAIAINALVGEVTANGPGVVAATISAGAVTNTKLAAVANNTVKGNKSGAPASPSDLALSSVTEAVSSVLTISNGSKTVVSAADLTIEVKQSSALQSGYLSSTDWSTFNSKQPAGNYITDLTGEVTATGPGSVAATIAANAVTNAKLAKMAANTIKGNNTAGLSDPLDLTTAQTTAMLNVMVGDSGAGGTKGLVPAPAVGDAQKVLSGGGTWQYAGHGDGSFGSNNIFLGRGKANTTGTENIIISNVNSVTTGIRNTIVGANTFNVTTGDGNILIGYGAQLVSPTNSNAYAIGGTANGYGTAIRGRAGTFSVAIGATAGNTGHSYGVAIGDDAVRNAASGSYHVGIGYKALNSVASGSGSIGIGPFAGRYSTTASELYIGNQEYGNNVLEKANSIIYGVMAVGSTSQTLALNAAVTAKHGFTTTTISQNGATSGTLTQQVPASVTSYAVTWPSAQGAASTYLKNDGSGNLSWDIATAGINTVGAFSASSQANGATISGSTITFGPADGTNPGMVSTGSQTIAGTKTFTGTIQNTNYILSPQLYDAGAQTINFSLDWANGPEQKFTINAAGPLAVTLSNPVTGGTYLLRIEQGATPGTLTWPGTVIWGTVGAPVLSTSTGNVDLVSLFYDGTNYYGSYQIQTALPAANYSLTNLSFAGANGQVIELAGGVPTWQNKYPAQAGNQDKVLVTSGSAASWQYAGLGDGTLPTNVVLLGVARPASLPGGVLICGPGTASSISNAGGSNILIGVGIGVNGASFTNSSLTTGLNNVFVGNLGNNVTTGRENTAIGARYLQSGLSSTATETTVVGANINCASGNGGTAVGAFSAIGSNAVAVGRSSDASGTETVSVGYLGGSFSSPYAVAIGPRCTARSSTGYGVTVGAFAGGNNSISVGGYNVLLGAYAGNGLNNSTATRNVFLGHSAGRYNTNQADELFIDNQDRTNYANQQTNSLVYGKFNATPSSQTFTLNAAVTSTYGFVANEIGGDFDTRIEGDTDANLLFVDAGTDRVGIGNNAPAVKLHTQSTTAATNTVTNVLRVDSQSSGTPATGIGVGIEMAAETAAGNTEIGVVLEAVTTNVTSTSEDFDLVVKNMAAGATAAETLRVASTGDVTAKTGNILIDTAGKGLSIKSGSNAKIGVTGAFPSGNPNSVTVSTTAVTSNSIILVSPMTFTGGITGAPFVSAITAGTSFVITVPDNSFTGTVGWVIIEKS